MAENNNATNSDNSRLQALSRIKQFSTQPDMNERLLSRGPEVYSYGQGGGVSARIALYSQPYEELSFGDGTFTITKLQPKVRGVQRGSNVPLVDGDVVVSRETYDFFQNDFDTYIKPYVDSWSVKQLDQPGAVAQRTQILSKLAASAKPTQSVQSYNPYTGAVSTGGRTVREGSKSNYNAEDLPFRQQQRLVEKYGSTVVPTSRGTYIPWNKSSLNFEQASQSIRLDQLSRGIDRSPSAERLSVEAARTARRERALTILPGMTPEQRVTAYTEMRYNKGREKLGEEIFKTLKAGGKVNFFKDQEGLLVEFNQEVVNNVGSTRSNSRSNVLGDSSNFGLFTREGTLEGMDIQSTVTEAKRPELKILELDTWLSDYSSRAEFTSQQSTGFKKNILNLAAFSSKAGSVILSPILSPVDTAKGIFKSGYELVTDPIGTGFKIGKSIALEPSGFFGGIAGSAATGKVYGKALDVSKDVYVASGSRFIEPNKVFDVKVLEGKTQFPLNKGGTKQALKEFNKVVDGEVRVVTASPAKIGGKEVKIMEQAGLQDSGIYVTPKGKGSPYFLKVDPDIPSEYSINPLKAIGVPTVTEFGLNKVTTYPKKVLSSAGFEEVQKFQLEQAGRKTGFITKRSMIGQGELPAKKFEYNKIIKKEMGTSELEAVIGVGEKFEYIPKSIFGKVKGFDEYTKYLGRNVAIRKAKLFENKPSVENVYRFKKVISGEQVRRESSSLSKKYKSPYPYLSGVVGSKIIQYYSSGALGYSMVSGGSSTSGSSYFRISKSYGSSKRGSISSIVKSYSSKGSSQKSSSSKAYSYGGLSKLSSSSLQSSSYGGSSSFGNSYKTPPTPPIVPPPVILNIPNFKLGFKFDTSGGSSKNYRKFSYTPSVTAIVLGIKGKKPKRYNPLQIRPVIR